jgi:hypothetical protein
MAIGGYYNNVIGNYSWLLVDIVATLTLGSWPRQGGCKVAGQEGGPIVTSHVPESAKSVREWTLTLSNELPLWDLESQMVQWVLYIVGKLSTKATTFVLDLIEIGGLHAKLRAPKVTKVLIVGIPKLPFGSPGIKCHLDVAPVERRKEYYKGEGGGFPQVRVVMSLVNLRLPVVRANTKSFQTMH